jgi:hypothetical protein
MVIAVLLVVVRPAQPRPTALGKTFHHAPMVKPEAAIAVVELLRMGVEAPKTC